MACFKIYHAFEYIEFPGAIVYVTLFGSLILLVMLFFDVTLLYLTCYILILSFSNPFLSIESREGVDMDEKGGVEELR